MTSPTIKHELKLTRELFARSMRCIGKSQEMVQIRKLIPGEGLRLMMTYAASSPMIFDNYQTKQVGGLLKECKPVTEQQLATSYRKSREKT